jgi:hypothetical protein
MDPVPNFVKGGTPTLLDTETANKVGAICNAFNGLTFQPDNLAKLEVADKTAKVAFKTIKTLGVLNGQVTWFEVVGKAVATAVSDA